MPRARNIKPGFYKNEELAECSVWARFIFPGLWMMADREGRLEDRPKRIKGELLAYDSQDVEPLLHELEQRGFIARYKADGKAIIQVAKFSQHQNPHHREAESRLPPQAGPGLEAGGSRAKPEAVTACDGTEAQDKPQASPGLGRACDPQDTTCQGGLAVLNPDSGFLIPDTSASRPKARGKQVPSEGFAEFWAAYPRKVAKEDAVKAFARLVSPDAVPAVIAALNRQRSTEQWQRDGGKYIPHPATWITGRRWEDEPDTPTSAADDLRPAWALRAGFPNRFEAENAGCFERNHHTFADGHRLETA